MGSSASLVLYNSRTSTLEEEGPLLLNFTCLRKKTFEVPRAVFTGLETDNGITISRISRIEVSGVNLRGKNSAVFVRRLEIAIACLSSSKDAPVSSLLKDPDTALFCLGLFSKLPRLDPSLTTQAKDAVVRLLMARANGIRERLARALVLAKELGHTDLMSQLEHVVRVHVNDLSAGCAHPAVTKAIVAIDKAIAVIAQLRPQEEIAFNQQRGTAEKLQNAESKIEALSAKNRRLSKLLEFKVQECASLRDGLADGIRDLTVGKEKNVGRKRGARKKKGAQRHSGGTREGSSNSVSSKVRRRRQNVKRLLRCKFDEVAKLRAESKKAAIMWEQRVLEAERLAEQRLGEAERYKRQIEVVRLALIPPA